MYGESCKAEAGVAEVELERVVKRFGEVVAVDGIDLAIRHAELIALLGPSGCGKTTTLRMIAGLDHEDSGDIRIDGQSQGGVPPWNRDLGFMFQNYALFPHMSVFDNIAYGLRIRKWDSKRIKNRVQEVARFVAIERLLERYPRQLSGGQQQRVALARAMAIEPRVLLMDEPLTGLDAKLREEVRFEFKSIQRETDITVIYVTHDQDEAFTLADRVVVMNQGRIEQVGTPIEIYEDPATSFVADFIGSNNALAGVISEIIDGSVLIRCGNLVFQAPQVEWARVGTTVTVIMRMSKLHLAPAQTISSGPNAFCGEVRGATFVGSTERVIVDVGGTLLKVDYPSGTEVQRFAVGDHVNVAISDRDVRYFTASDGQA
jgi:ABC-type Fe3+/spermidine/putrescine transport system ATPase subunit